MGRNNERGIVNELWVARDDDGKAWIYDTKPVWIEDTRRFTGPSCGKAYGGTFPNLKPGECRRLVMESEVSE
jgi:hypothetical protein